MKQITVLAVTIGLTFVLAMLAFAAGTPGNAPKPVIGFRVVQGANSYCPPTMHCGVTVLDNAALNGNPDAVFVVTPVGNDGRPPDDSVAYDQTGVFSPLGPGHWVIFVQGSDDAFNVLALK